MHFVGPDQLHGFQRRLTTDIYPAGFDWVKDEWIRIKETRGEDYEAIMGDRQGYHAPGYTGQAVKVDHWHNALSYDEETHFRAVEYLRAQRGPTRPFFFAPLTTTRTSPATHRKNTETSTRTPISPFPSSPAISTTATR